MSKVAGPPAANSIGAMAAGEALASLWRDTGLPPAALERVNLTGRDPVLPSSFALGAAAQAAVAASALAAAELGRLRGGPVQHVTVDMRHAAIAFHSERWLRVDGAAPADPWDRIAGAYRCGDGRWARLHTNFPHHRDGVLALLGCAYERDAVGAALRNWRAVDLEAEAATAGLCVTALRSFAEWDAHPQGVAVAAQPVVAITRIGDAAPRRRAPGATPLAGLRVLELTRVIAGPVCGRTLAAHGADVMLVTGPHLPAIPTLVVDTGRGKLSAALDLRAPDGRVALAALTRDADIFLQGYRPGGLARLGFGPADTARLSPGIIHVSLSAYGPEGPWSGRRGFDSLTQTASGFNHAEAEAAGDPGQPKPLPVQALDHGSGYLLAFGALAALQRQMQEGGSWHVEVSLARTGQWIRSLGCIANGLACPASTRETIADLLEDSESGFGRLSAVRHPALLSHTPPAWTRPAVPLGTHPPRWP
jgi:crotonobetainyl-CoA:carnitine CoA-transferase CaiB-like acyl-CoA transferase